MPKNIFEQDFAVFDTETTGLNPSQGDRIIEIAAERLHDAQVTATFERLVNPGRPVSEAAYAVNGISEEMLASAPRMDTVMPEFLEFVQGCILCSYNAPFDMGFLLNEISLTGASLPEDTLVVDVLKMARRLLPGMPRYALWFVAQSLGVGQKQQHRALSDVSLTREVFNRLLDIAELKGIRQGDVFKQLFCFGSSALQGLTLQKIARIQEAIGLGVKLKIRYLAGCNAEVTEREVTPREIRQEKDRAYLVGHCSLRSQERTFRVDNILQIEIAGPS